jgi:hypothetical protein
LEQVYGKLGAETTLCCLMVFERYLLLSPRFRTGRGPCPTCYLSRLVSHPPPFIDAESMWASREAIERLPDFEYEGLPFGLAQLAAHLCLLRGEEARSLSTAIDIGSLHVCNAKLAPLHRCACRERTRQEDPAMERFVQFVSTLPQPYKPC